MAPQKKKKPNQPDEMILKCYRCSHTWFDAPLSGQTGVECPNCGAVILVGDFQGTMELGYRIPSIPDNRPPSKGVSTSDIIRELDRVSTGKTTPAPRRHDDGTSFIKPGAALPKGEGPAAEVSPPPPPAPALNVRAERAKINPDDIGTAELEKRRRQTTRKKADTGTPEAVAPATEVVVRSVRVTRTGDDETQQPGKRPVRRQPSVEETSDSARQKSINEIQTQIMAAAEFDVHDQKTTIAPVPVEASAPSKGDILRQMDRDDDDDPPASQRSLSDVKTQVMPLASAVEPDIHAAKTMIRRKGDVELSVPGSAAAKDDDDIPIPNIHAAQTLVRKKGDIDTSRPEPPGEVEDPDVPIPNINAAQTIIFRRKPAKDPAASETTRKKDRGPDAGDFERDLRTPLAARRKPGTKGAEDFFDDTPLSVHSITTPLGRRKVRNEKDEETARPQKGRQKGNAPSDILASLLEQPLTPIPIQDPASADIREIARRTKELTARTKAAQQEKKNKG